MEEETPTFLEQVKAEREALEKIRDEIKGETAKLQELKATEILSGKTDAGQKPKEKKPEVSPLDYAMAAKRGVILE